MSDQQDSDRQTANPEPAVVSPAERFWRDPPWRGGRTPFRMGLREIGEARWLDEPMSVNERVRKEQLFVTRRDLVLRAVAGFEVLEQEVAAVVTDALARRRQDPATDPAGFPSAAAVFPSAAALARVAMLVPDDLCLLSPGDAGYRLVSACLCSPSYWRLGEKIGRPIREIHGPVAGLNEAVGDSVGRFLERLPVGRIFERRNWSIHRGDALFHPDDEVWEAPVVPADCPALFVRSETQTLRKFDNGAVLFTIRVGHYPLVQIEAHPDAAADMLAAVDSMSAAERQAFGYAHHGPALRSYLATLL